MRHESRRYLQSQSRYRPGMVVARDGRLVGVLSLDEVLDALAEELTDVATSIRHELKAESAVRP